MYLVVGLVGLLLGCHNAYTRVLDDSTEHWIEYEDSEEVFDGEHYYETQHSDHQHRYVDRSHHDHKEEHSIEEAEIRLYKQERRLAEENQKEMFIDSFASELAEEEWIEEFERGARASDRGIRPIPEPTWYPYPWEVYPWDPMAYNLPYYLPYYVPPPYPAHLDTPLDSVQQLIPVKGKVTIVGSFGNCNWNMPTPMIPMPPIAPMPMPVDFLAHPVECCDGATVPVRSILPASGKVVIAAHFDC